MNTVQNPVQLAVRAVGGPTAVAKLCGLSPVAVHKWIRRGSLPRTEYTGKTEYSKIMSHAAQGLFSAEWLMNAANPDR